MVCLMQHRRKYQAKILMKVLVLKLKSVNSKMSGSQSFLVSLVIYDSSNDVMYCYCVFAERQAQVLLAKPNLLLEANLNVKVLFRPKKNMCFRSTGPKKNRSAKFGNIRGRSILVGFKKKNRDLPTLILKTMQSETHIFFFWSYHNKSLKRERYFNVVSGKAHSSTKYLLSPSGH